MAAPNKLSFYVPEQYGHDDFLIALALCSRAACSQTRANTYKWDSWIVPPAPTEWDLEEQQLKVAQITAGLERDFRAALRAAPSSPPPPPPSDRDTDRSYRWRDNLPTNLHSSDPPPPSQMAADADALYDRMRRNMGLDP